MKITFLRGINFVKNIFCVVYNCFQRLFKYLNQKNDVNSKFQFSFITKHTEKNVNFLAPDNGTLMVYEGVYLRIGM